MAKVPKPSEDSGRQQMLTAAKKGLEGQGYRLDRVPGRGLSSVWNVERQGKVQAASIRTTRDRWIAFPPLRGGTKWKTLDDVDLVVVAAVDSKDSPKNIEVYILPANEIRQRFNAAYAARKNAGQIMRDDFGMWVGLDTDTRDIPVSIGSGITEKHKPVAIYPTETLVAADSPRSREISAPSAVDRVIQRPTLETISDVMAWARQRVSEIAGVRVESVKLDLKIEY